LGLTTATAYKFPLQMTTYLRLGAVLCTSVLVVANNGAVAADGPKPAPLVVKASAEPPLFVGLRRSSYGLRKFNTNDIWWAERAKQFASHFHGAQPLILHILSNYQDDGTTQIEFKKPDAYQGPTTNMSFLPRGKLNHERALTTYDEQGVKAILQFEPGDADVGDCFALAHEALGRHPCVVGFAIDGEWFKTKQSPDQAGLPITDAEAQRWMNQVLSFNTNYVLVLKHFEKAKLPATYRHPQLWFLTDSQEFNSQEEWMKDMRDWASAFNGSPIGSQYGYPKDQKWWQTNASPAVDLGRALLRSLPEYQMILWVDFTANKVQFGHD
jgi:hypothetical protein